MIGQLAIAFFGVAAVWVSQSKDYHQRRWAPVFGLLGQPFWFFETIGSEQWGMVAISVCYTWAWSRGFYLHWIRSAKK